MGNAGSALETYIYLDRISPLFVFLCGIAGSLDPANVHLGDVVVARSVDWWQLNKLSSDTFAQAYTIGDKFFRIHREPPLPCFSTEFCGRLIDQFVKNQANSGLLPSNHNDQILRFKKQYGVTDNRIHMGDIVSWEYVLSDAVIRQDVLDRSTASLAIEMEGAGFTYALKRRCQEMQRLGRGHLLPSGFIFRGISDLSARKDREHKQWQSIAMFNAASAIVRFLNTFDDEMFFEGAESIAS
jgi:nucleoside phosphorylase